MEEIAASVRDARKLAHYVIVSIHAHEGAQSRELPAQFLIAFAHAMIDAGADIFVGHGPHVLRGVEIYKSKPILYSLGDFIFQNETLLRLASGNLKNSSVVPTHTSPILMMRGITSTAVAFQPTPRSESVIAVPSFRAGKMTTMRFYPISLGYGRAIPDRGRPMLADPQLSRQIIERLAKLSTASGTKIEYRDGIGTAAGGQCQRSIRRRPAGDAAGSQYGCGSFTPHRWRYGHRPDHGICQATQTGHCLPGHHDMFPGKLDMPTIPLFTSAMSFQKRKRSLPYIGLPGVSIP